MSSSLLVGTSCASTENTMTLSNHAINKRSANTLVLPPFFSRPTDDDGIVDFYQQFVRRLRTNAQNIVLYHFPETAGDELSVDAIQRLVTTFPNASAGLQDSSGNLISTFTFINAYPDLAIHWRRPPALAGIGIWRAWHHHDYSKFVPQRSPGY
ncbi:dihydrodipicolinate synthase family protein [Epibacterium ulvae]|uniref:dihydrodipicolinate synthase family protein n=1 Tax=Epibacterium ulvae TaxID=1156985 RepID=UPI0038BC48C0